MSEKAQRLLPTVLRLLRPFALIVAVATLAGVASGLATAGLLATVNRGLHDAAGVTTTLVLSFIGLFAIVFLGEIASDIGNSFVGQKIIAALRDELSAKILRAPIAEIERYQSHRLLMALNQDIGTVSSFTFNFSSFAISIAVTLGCFGYMLWLSPPMFLLTLVAVALGSALTTWARARGMSRFSAAWEAENRLQKQYTSIIEGAKELRMHRPRRADMYENKIRGTTKQIADTFIGGMAVFCAANAFGSALFFFVIGLLLMFHSGASTGAQNTISGFVLVLLYVRGPLGQIIGQLPMFARAQVAMRHIAELSTSFATPEQGLQLTGAGGPDALPPIESIRLRGIEYRFPPQGGNPGFVLGPIDLCIERGQIIFITGENGGGKTTLVKVLLGLYPPSSGSLLVNERDVTAAELDDYRQSFATIFSDYFLFDELSLPHGILPEDAQRYLKRMELAHKVEVTDGRFTTTDLSTGQRKRLALIHAWVEGRPVLVFDEWAADQDPEFRRIFYTEILPALKQQGRTVIAISHDDRYYHVADLRITLRDGQVVDRATGSSAVARDELVHAP